MGGRDEHEGLPVREALLEGHPHESGACLSFPPCVCVHHTRYPGQIFIQYMIYILLAIVANQR